MSFINSICLNLLICCHVREYSNQHFYMKTHYKYKRKTWKDKKERKKKRLKRGGRVTLSDSYLQTAGERRESRNNRAFSKFCSFISCRSRLFYNKRSESYCTYEQSKK